MLGSVVLAQSKKERYTLLLGELNTAYHTYDSTRQGYLVQHRFLETTFGAANGKLRELYQLEEKMKDLSGSILEKTNMLDDLEVDYRTILDKKTLQTSTELDALTRRVRTVNMRQGDFWSLDTLHLKDLKTAKKNEMISKQLVVLSNNTKACSDQIRIERSRIDSVQKLNQELESMLNRNMGLAEKLRVADEQLNAKLKELETAYLTKGPKGFNEKYKKYFPLINEDVYESFGVSPVPKPQSVQEPEIFEVVEEPASFPGGMEALKKYLSTNLVYPQTAKDAGISGKVYLKFVISDKGTISNVKMMKGVPNCSECDKEAIRVVKSMPNWIPGKNKGKAVNSVFTLPVTFKL